MSRLPHRDRAALDLRKFEDCCLNPSHPRGRHKARVFREALGIGKDDAHWLQDAILAALADCNATELEADALGTRWRVDMPITRHGKAIMIRTIWIVRSGELAPRFVTCWVL
jgi:hypothetical protein